MQIQSGRTVPLIYAHRGKEILSKDCLYPVGVFSFHNWKYICPKSTQSNLLNIVPQLCIPTNQLAQPNSQSLNKYFCKGMSSPPSLRCHKVYFYSMAEGFELTCPVGGGGGGVEGGEGGWDSSRLILKKQEILIAPFIKYAMHLLARTWEWGAAIGFLVIHILMLGTVHYSFCYQSLILTIGFQPVLFRIFSDFSTFFPLQ